MTARERLEVESSAIEADREFADGCWTESLYFHNRNHQLLRPLSSEALYAFKKEKGYATVW